MMFEQFFCHFVKISLQLCEFFMQIWAIFTTKKKLTLPNWTVSFDILNKFVNIWCKIS